MKETSKKPPKDELSQNQNAREAILAIALKAFACDGFDGASLPKIAKMAQVAPSLIHYYFDSKDKLWRETIDFSLGQLRREAATIRNATRSLAPLDRLRVILQAFTHFAARCPDHFGMILAEARSNSDRFDWIRENYTDVIFGDVVSILQEARDQSLIKDVSLDQVALMLIGGILVYFTFDPMVTVQKDIEKAADEYTDLLFMLLDGLMIKPTIA